MVVLDVAEEAAGWRGRGGFATAASAGVGADERRDGLAGPAARDGLAARSDDGLAARSDDGLAARSSGARTG